MEVPRSAPQATIHPTGGTPLHGPRAPRVSRQHAPHLGKGRGHRDNQGTRGSLAFCTEDLPPARPGCTSLGLTEKLQLGSRDQAWPPQQAVQAEDGFPGEDAPDDLNPADGMLLEIRLRGTRVQQPLTQGSPLSTGSLLSKQQSRGPHSTLQRPVLAPGKARKRGVHSPRPHPSRASTA